MKKLIKIIEIKMEYTREQLRKFYMQIQAFENGASIEFFFQGNWYQAKFPSFDLSLEYRVEIKS